MTTVDSFDLKKFGAENVELIEAILSTVLGQLGKEQSDKATVLMNSLCPQVVIETGSFTFTRYAYVKAIRKQDRGKLIQLAQSDKRRFVKVSTKDSALTFKEKTQCDKAIQRYKDGIAKIKNSLYKFHESSLALSQIRFFHYPNFERWSRTIFRYDPVHAREVEPVTLDEKFQFDLQDVRIVQAFD